ncbi:MULTISPECIES: nitroreductase family protein [Alphaproteobacteria]|uniref:NAD(P)H-flavin oxidoreductase n=2 Tax=Alphaproteobacteria TaxID=28211 RepID=A0A512HMA0_9HYPH|nr:MULTISPECIES: nitroreductase family protein [Alphaproteobacteria]GEO86582.1 NAD(P)H-flavin oxidoreductase [Ciceribacter naphthalenivorans]GLR20846.1 NAD(P)H-flavin oxidoreductase [Ciceribacter naphthalenivorans]GLT03702.1 NAD(P)H-flavin oxidoreductase [Sphingomonas psychrolutea]
MTTSNSRTSEFDIDPIFLDRWSPRAFTGEAMDETVLLTILEAAHWAPSANNYQPWRFVYALNSEPEWDRFVGLLNESNQVWAKSASALVFLFSDTLSRRHDGSEPRLMRSHSFDTGAAWAMMSLQALRSGYLAHAMAGVDFDEAIKVLGAPVGFHAEAAVAIGKRADPAGLPDHLKAREMPNGRKKLADVAFARGFPVG